MGYIDTSVLAAYYCPEPLSGAAQKAIRKLDTPAISLLVEVEFHSAIALKVRTGECEIATANRIVSQFRLHAKDGYYRILPLHTREYELARDWIARFSTPLRTLDALHLATASSHDLTLLTADKLLAQSARRLGVRSRLIS
jgi:predicted nucleic acid-binding protein